MPKLPTSSASPLAMPPRQAVRYARWLFVGVVIGTGAAALLPVQYPAAAPNAFEPADSAWMLSASGLVLLRAPGLAFFYGGIVSSRHVFSTVLQSVIALGVISGLWNVVSFSLAFDDSWHGLLWFNLNAGSALGANPVAVTALFNTQLASAAAMCTWQLLEVAQRRRPSAFGACLGAVVGLVAITPAAGYVSYAASVFIGVLAAAVSRGALWFKHGTTVDDPLEVFVCHGVGGLTGRLATALFATQGGLFTGGGWSLLYYHGLALSIVAAFTFNGSWLLLQLTKWLIPLRVSETAETVGLDPNQHNESFTPRVAPIAEPQEVWLTAAEVVDSLPALHAFKMQD